MPRLAKGSEIFWGADGVPSTRITLQAQRSMMRMPECRAPDLPPSAAAVEAAENKRTILADVARRLTDASTDYADAFDALTTIAKAPSSMTLAGALKFAGKLIKGQINLSETPTIKEIGDSWLDGTLHKDIEPLAAKTVRNTRYTLDAYVYPLVGHVQVNRFTFEHGEQVKNALPPDAHRRNSLQPLTRILSLAVQLRHITQSPLPEGWLPAIKKARDKQWLYPSEDSTLMACTAVPLARRMLWGYFVREGGRDGETIRLLVRMFDLRTGGATVPGSLVKGGERKIWALLDGTRLAMAAWVALRNAQPGDRMFVDADGQPIGNTRRLPDWLRDDLRTAGIDRPELFLNDGENKCIVPHHLRGSMVTVAIANGRDDRWIIKRTGHASPAQIKTYEELAESFTEMQQAQRDYLPLHEAIPELRAITSDPSGSSGKSHSKANGSGNHAESLGLAQYRKEVPCYAQPSDMPKVPANPLIVPPSSPVQPSVDGQSLAFGLMLEALAQQLTERVTAGVVAELVKLGVVNRPRPALVAKATDDDDDDLKNR